MKNKLRKFYPIVIGIVILIFLALLLFVPTVFVDEKIKIAKEFCPDFELGLGTNEAKYYCNGKEFICQDTRCNFIN